MSEGQVKRVCAGFRLCKYVNSKTAVGKLCLVQILLDFVRCLVNKSGSRRGSSTFGLIDRQRLNLPRAVKTRQRFAVFCFGRELGVAVGP